MADTKMRYLAGLAIILLVLLTTLMAFAWPKDKPVTPYGDFCPLCSQYGICKFLMSPEDAEEAMRDYYNKKGLDVEVEDMKGRFIRARIMDKDRAVDTIIFDRRTGRIRSIY